MLGHWLDSLNMFDHLFPAAMAMAKPEGGGQGGGFEFMLPLLMMFAVFYFLVIRPQKKQAERHRDFLKNLEKGQEVVTSGGIYGKVAGIAENNITLEIAGGVKIKVVKGHINRVQTAKAENQAKAVAAASGKGK